MGGNVIQNCERITAAEYEMITKSLNAISTGPYLNVIASYTNKPDHGDIDVLVSLPENSGGKKECKEAVYQILTRLERLGWNVTQISQNDTVISVGIIYPNIPKIVQIDFICIFGYGAPLTFAWSYFSYNDLGNLIGRVAHGMGLKFGHDGLWYIHRDGDYVLKEILLTDNFYEAIRHLGFDDYGYVIGFDNLTDIFDYVISSKYFDTDLYPLEHRSYTARVRDRKRKTYMAFLEYVHANPPKRNSGLWKAGKNCLWYHIGQFPHLAAEIEEADLRNDCRKKLKLAFDAVQISQICGIEGQLLGGFLKWLKAPHKDITDYDAIPDPLSEDEILQKYGAYLIEDSSSK